MSVTDRLFVELILAVNRVKGLGRDEDGQALAEYGLILALVAVVVIAAVTLIGTNLNTKLNAIANAL